MAMSTLKTQLIITRLRGNLMGLISISMPAENQKLPQGTI
jgi:hypothetical protein